MSFSCKNLHLIRTKGTKSSCEVSVVLCPFAGQAIQCSWILVLLILFFVFTAWAQHLPWRHTCVYVWFYFISSVSRMTLPWLASEEFPGTLVSCTIPGYLQFCGWLLTLETQSGKMVGTKSHTCWVNKGDPNQLGLFLYWSIWGRYCNTLLLPTLKTQHW